MRRTSSTLRLLMAIIAIAIVALPLSGAHLHLCFDGTEPAVSVHTAAHGTHHAGASASLHHDVDVNLASGEATEPVLKKAKAPLLFVAFALLLVLLVPSRNAIAPLRARARVPSRKLRILPPLRAPPALAFP